MCTLLYTTNFVIFPFIYPFKEKGTGDRKNQNMYYRSMSFKVLF